MDHRIAIISIVITFALIFILNREGRKIGLSVGPLQSIAIALVVFFLVLLAFHIKKYRGSPEIPLEQVRVTKLVPLEQSYCLSGLDDSIRKNILGLAQLSEGIPEERIEESLRGLYVEIEPDGLIEWAMSKIQHLKRYSAGPTVHDITLRPGMGEVEQALLHQLLDAHGIPRQIALLDIILDTYATKQKKRLKSGRDRKAIQREFKERFARVRQELESIDLQAKPWSQLSLEEDLK